MRRRSWCADIGEIRVAWRHAPKDVVSIPNGAFVPEEAEGERPKATDDEVLRMCAAFDAFCDGIESLPAPAEPAEKGETSSPGIPLDEDDILEFILDGPLVEMSITQDSVPIRVPEKSLALT